MSGLVHHTDQILGRWQESIHAPLSVDARLLAEVLVTTSTGITFAWLSTRDDHVAHAYVALLTPALARSVGKW